MYQHGAEFNKALTCRSGMVLEKMATCRNLLLEFIRDLLHDVRLPVKMFGD
jgi:hypothetical protein